MADDQKVSPPMLTLTEVKSRLARKLARVEASLIAHAKSIEELKAAKARHLACSAYLVAKEAIR